MAKNALIFSPFFFGLLFLFLIPLVSGQGGGVRGQAWSSTPFASRVQQNTCFGCDGYCKSLALPTGFSTQNLGVKSGQCSQLAANGPVTEYLCLCGVV
ncbi:hypothetical protein C5167_047641 [Papaver somniferum]|uniref:Uncharacterized protein n=1 Tax=Papaver somniferum TaxID=3469 RepID=A0A4Y7LK57_PAPSO|nr:hypothetical protein C5167_047641 [Papaver somniferum]